MKAFEQNLDYGIIGESEIAKFFRSHGYFVLPVYQSSQQYKGPRLYAPSKFYTRELIAPDMFVFRLNPENQSTQAYWIEAKHKTTFPYFRKKGIWTTGIDKVVWADYLSIQQSTPWPVWLLFLHRGGRDKHTGMISEAGLFGETISKLQYTIDNECSADQMGKSGMVYWNKNSLRKLASIEEFDERLRLTTNGQIA